MPDTTLPDERRITLRVPPILALKVDKLVAARQAEFRKFSLNDWIIEAIREKADETPKAIAAKVPGLSVGVTPRSAPPAATPQPQYRQAPKAKCWLSELQRLARQSEVDPEGAATEEAKLLDGFKRPKGWAGLDLEHRAAHLDRFFPLGGAAPAADVEEADAW